LVLVWSKRQATWPCGSQAQGCSQRIFPVIHGNHLGIKTRRHRSRIFVRIASDVASFQVLSGTFLTLKPYLSPGIAWECECAHLDRFDFSDYVGQTKSKCIPGFIIPVRRVHRKICHWLDILERNAKRLVRAFGCMYLVKEPPRGTDLYLPKASWSSEPCCRRPA
jgi:hypothetical protein